VLPADEREPLPEFGQGVLQPVGQGPFGGPVGQPEEVEDVGVLDDLLGLIRVERIELLVEVAGGGPDPAMQSGGDMVFQHWPGPPVERVPGRRTSPAARGP
jgi:hypothetical protein